ncbi:hypothetical protein HO133_002978 [Letharia lupina]|uniref:Uncharacterized protein n=1 Tax=Letharia lupina TaxID=560253 RepID=A0A8H6CBJ8_9LECA|nr:uncharacterized protein HO133_002978 [Letharia lupina]KAF6220545.1 hypothetical protein HO133_002978 [Letharia lupina]
MDFRGQGVVICEIPGAILQKFCFPISNSYRWVAAESTAEGLEETFIAFPPAVEARFEASSPSLQLQIHPIHTAPEIGDYQGKRQSVSPDSLVQLR